MEEEAQFSQQPGEVETNGQASQTYLSFEELPKPDSDLTLEQLKAILTDQSNWKAQFTALDSLRTLNKWAGQEFCGKLLFQVLAELLVLADSIRSNLSKNALLLIHEIIANNDLGQIPTEILAPLIQKIVEKSISEKNFIRLESKAALVTLENKLDALQEGVILSLCQLSQDKNPNIQELAGSSLSAVISRCRKQINIINDSAYAVLVNSTFKCLNGKRMQLKKSAKEIGNVLLAERGQAAFGNILSPADEKVMLAALAEKQQEQKPSFKDFLAMKKKEGDK